MAVKVVRPPQEEPVLRTTCDCCIAELEYNPSDIRTTSRWATYGEMVEEYIYCPACSSKVVINGYWKERERYDYRK